MAASLTPTRMAEPAFSEAAALCDTTHNSSVAGVAPVVFFSPKLPETVTNPPTVALSPVTVSEEVLSTTRNGTATATAPTERERVRSISAPVLLKAIPISVAVALAKPSPRLRSTAPVACSASFWSPRIITTIVALLTPARTKVPAVSEAAAWFETISSSS